MISPLKKAEKAPAMARLMENIRDGLTTAQIIEDDPKMAFKIRDIDTLRQTLLSERYATENRDLQVAYFYGASGAGKTRYIYEQHNPARSAASPITGREKALSLTDTTGRKSLCLRNFTPRCP